MKRFFALLAAMLGIAIHQAPAVEGPPKLVPYQGMVLDAQGAPLAPTQPTVYKIEFRLWNQLTGGTLVWSEQQFVTVSNGRFSVNLGEGTAATDAVAPQFVQSALDSAFAEKSRYLGVTVRSSPTATEMIPRLAFLSAPYAFVAGTVSRVSQQPGTFSNVKLASIRYTTRTVDSGSPSVALTLDQRTNLVSAGSRGTVAQLPIAGGLQELLVAKMDTTDKVVAIAPPPNGTINGSTDKIRLKALGESVTLQNIDGDNWWIVKDTRDNTPVGSIISYGAANPPPGYLACDGSSLHRDDHPDLFAVISTAWGSASEVNALVQDANRFNLPNLSGRFVRGVDPEADGADDDAGSRINLFAGGNAGRQVGSYQKDEFAIHGHNNGSDPGHSHPTLVTSTDTWKFGLSYDAVDLDGGATAGKPALNDGAPRQYGHRLSVTVSQPTVSSSFTGITKTEDAGGNETRPENAGVRYCIKY